MLYFDSEAHQNATTCLVLPGAVLHLSVFLAFRDCGNKAGAMRGFQLMEEHNLGQVISTKLHRGSTTVCAYRNAQHSDYPYLADTHVYQFKKAEVLGNTEKKTAFAENFFQFGVSVL